MNNKNPDRTWSVGVKIAHVFHRHSDFDFTHMPRFRSYKMIMDCDATDPEIYYRYIVHCLKQYHRRYDFDLYMEPEYANYDEYAEVAYP
jgi:hypothetical protein